MTFALDLRFDRRWQKLHDPNFVCRACGQKHGGVFEVNFEKPFQWRGGERQDGNSPDIDPRNYLLEDFCVIDNKQFFIRAVGSIPILGSETQGKDAIKLLYSAWVSLSAADFDRYGDSYDSPDQTALGPFIGKLANRIAPFPDTLDLPIALLPQKGNYRPHIYVDAPEHPLAIAHKDGFTFESLLNFYAASGHDIRPGLSTIN